MKVAALGWFGVRLGETDTRMGDFIVGTDSATAGADETRLVRCEYRMDVVQDPTNAAISAYRFAYGQEAPADPVAIYDHSACWHGNLTRAIELTNETTAIIDTDINSRRPVVTDTGYGAIRIGMTEEQVRAVLSPITSDETYYRRCKVLTSGTDPDQAWGLSVWINTDKGVVTGIETPPGTMTDRGVGDGSTMPQIRAAYESDHRIDVEGQPNIQGGQNIYLRRRSSTSEDVFIAFRVDRDGSIGPPNVGRNTSRESC